MIFGQDRSELRSMYSDSWQKARTGANHAAEHRLIECLAETLWEAQRDRVPPDEQAYLERVRRL